MSDDFDWVGKEEEKKKEARSKEYFNIEEGSNRFVLLSNLAPLAQVFEGGKYRAAVEGDDSSKISTKGLGWVYQDGMVKLAKIPYVVVKQLRGLQQNPDWEWKLPFPHVLTLMAEGAGTKEVKYSLTPAPKEVEVPKDILDILAKKPTPAEMVEKEKNRGKGDTKEDTREAPIEYPSEDIDPADIPF